MMREMAHVQPGLYHEAGIDLLAGTDCLNKRLADSLNAFGTKPSNAAICMNGHSSENGISILMSKRRQVCGGIATETAAVVRLDRSWCSTKLRLS